MTLSSEIKNQNPETVGARKKILSRPRILIVEDDDQLRDMLTEEVEEASYQVQKVRSAEEALPLIDQWHPDLILSDLRLPGRNGFDLLRHVQSRSLPPAFLLITAFGSIPEAVEALKAGADNFLTKPLDFDHLLLCISRALEVRSLKQEVEHFRNSSLSPRFHDIIGDSKSMKKLFFQIQQIARANGPVMIFGESGSGKELVAEAIHQESPLKEGPFIPVNCAGIPENLMESEFFGHAEGAFTGAKKAKKGLFEEANGGILFLDEVAELPLPMQGKLLRALEGGKIRPVGSNREREIDVRVIVATHQNIETAVAEGTFREDLYYRLETFILSVPSLRERGEDLELLAARFLHQYSLEIGKSVNGFSAEALRLIRSYPFPGNVRELQNAIKRAVTFCQDSTIEAEDLPERLKAGEGSRIRSGPGLIMDGSSLPSAEDRVITLEQMKCRYVRHILDQVEGNKRRAAALLGIGRRTLYEYLKKEEK
ncbi:MAG: sigma-54 dependent transcriptional regulator [Opitutales bacterium]